MGTMIGNKIIALRVITVIRNSVYTLIFPLLSIKEQ